MLEVDVDFINSKGKFEFFPALNSSFVYIRKEDKYSSIFHLDQSGSLLFAFTIHQTVHEFGMVSPFMLVWLEVNAIGCLDLNKRKGRQVESHLLYKPFK